MASIALEIDDMRANEIAAKRGRFISDPGDPIHVLYSPELQKDGSVKLVKVGTENTDEIIASYYESTTLEAILARFANGDLSALNRYQPIYADVSNAPKSLAEALQMVNNSRTGFDALPPEIKMAFDNNFNLWLSSAGTKEWYEAMSPVLAVAPDSSDMRKTPAVTPAADPVPAAAAATAE